MQTIAHIVNSVKVPRSSDLFIAQPITFESMKMACEFSKHSLDVSLYSAQYPEDHPIIPNYLTMTRDLDRSILDIDMRAGKRKLPLIKDILGRLYETSDADYFIYTNVDIGLQKIFYLAISAFINEGYDAFSITRRTIDSRFQRIDDIPQIYREKGVSHPGFDCFVFHRNLYPKFVLKNICLGVPPVGRILLCNLIRYADRFKIFRDEYLTFHIGRDGYWLNRVDKAHRINLKNGLKVTKKLYQSTNNSHRKFQLKSQLNIIVAESKKISPIRIRLKKVKRLINRLLRKVVK